MRIGDRQVRGAVETIIAELETMEQRILELQNEVSTLESKLEMKDIENDKLMNDIAELSDEVKRLDDALADTYIAQLDPKAKRDDASN